MAGEKILIVDDDADIREVISLYLENEGYQVVMAEDGNEALTTTYSENPDLIILDMMLPGLDGLEVCQEIRKEKTTPILFLSSKATPMDNILGLTAGGDDYINKPFDSGELLARVKAHLRRNRILAEAKETPQKESLLTFSDLTIDLINFSVEANGRSIVLSPKEFKLLTLLAQNPDRIFSSEDLYEALWGQESLGDHRTIMVHISNIRKKIEKDPANPRYIQTIKGVGYRFKLCQL